MVSQEDIRSSLLVYTMISFRQSLDYTSAIKTAIKSHFLKEILQY